MDQGAPGTGMSADHEDWMRQAVEAARLGIDDGQSPFGACIVRDGKAVACAHNVVWAQTDITAHAEIHAIRLACRRLGTIDLRGCVIYSTCEPCPMCFSAIHWSGIAEIFYGAAIADAKAAGFHELEISNRQMKEMGQSPVMATGGILARECRGLFDDWRKQSGRSY